MDDHHAVSNCHAFQFVHMNDFAIKIKLSWTINRKKTKLNERTYGDRQTAY